MLSLFSLSLSLSLVQFNLVVATSKHCGVECGAHSWTSALLAPSSPHRWSFYEACLLLPNSEQKKVKKKKNSLHFSFQSFFHAPPFFSSSTISQSAYSYHLTTNQRKRRRRRKNPTSVSSLLF